MASWETCPNLQNLSKCGRGRVPIWGRAESKVQTAFYCSEATISDTDGTGSASRRNELHQESHYACMPHGEPGKVSCKDVQVFVYLRLEGEQSWPSGNQC
jgi:hypothetical protein